MMSADFAVAQFRFLEPLLLVHGRWSYLRITRMVSYFFYKNLLFGLTIFFYNALCFFSGQILYNGKRSRAGPFALPASASPHSTLECMLRWTECAEGCSPGCWVAC